MNGIENNNCFYVIVFFDSSGRVVAVRNIYVYKLYFIQMCVFIIILIQIAMFCFGEYIIYMT